MLDDYVCLGSALLQADYVFLVVEEGGESCRKSFEWGIIWHCLEDSDHLVVETTPRFHWTHLCLFCDVGPNSSALNRRCFNLLFVPQS